jgi:hypothetical protein
VRAANGHNWRTGVKLRPALAYRLNHITSLYFLKTQLKESVFLQSFILRSHLPMSILSP